jgi:site-specific DNA-methyltransferase (adenine-specific)
MPSLYKIFHQNCLGLQGLAPNSVHALVTDPPYGIGFQDYEWDRTLPNRQIWVDCLEALKPGAFGLVFSSTRQMHRLMVDLEDSGFIIKDVLFWVYLNGMPKSRNVGLEIDKKLGKPSEIIGQYQYLQGYKKGGSESYTLNRKSKYKLKPASKEGKFFDGAGLGIKPAYEPIIMIQKPLEKGLSVAQNILKYQTGALNLEETRIPYECGEEGKVGHNPHPKGRVTSNIIRTESWEDGYDKFFTIPKVRQHADNFNHHPTLKPVELMTHLIKLVSFKNQLVLDPFMGSGSTGVACMQLERQFWGYEIVKEYFEISQLRLINSLPPEKAKRKKSLNSFNIQQGL